MRSRRDDELHLNNIASWIVALAAVLLPAFVASPGANASPSQQAQADGTVTPQQDATRSAPVIPLRIGEVRRTKTGNSSQTEAQALRATGLEAFRRKDYEAAKAAFLDLIRSHSDIATLTIASDYAMLATAHSILGEYAQARPLAEKVYAAIPQLSKREVIHFGAAQEYFTVDAFVTRLLVSLYRDLGMSHLALPLLGTLNRDQRLSKIGGKHYQTLMLLPSEVPLELMHYSLRTNLRLGYDESSLGIFLSFMETTQNLQLKAKEREVLLAILDHRTRMVVENKSAYCIECDTYLQRIEASSGKQKTSWQDNVLLDRLRARMLAIQGKLPQARRAYFKLLEALDRRLRESRTLSEADRRNVKATIIPIKVWFARLLLDQGDADLAYAQIKGARRDAEILFETIARKPEFAMGTMIDLVEVGNRSLKALERYDDIIELHQQFGGLPDSLFGYDPHTYFELMITFGEALVKTGRLSEAKTLIDKIREQFQPINQTSVHRISAALLAAEIADRDGQAEEAYRILNGCWHEGRCIGEVGTSGSAVSSYLMALFDMKWVEYLRKAKGQAAASDMLTDIEVMGRLERSAAILRALQQRGGYKGYARQVSSARLSRALKEVLSIEVQSSWRKAKSYELPAFLTGEIEQGKLVREKPRSPDLLDYSSDKLATGLQGSYNAGFKAAQETVENVASAALAQMALRHDATDAELAKLVREQQDLRERWSKLDSQLIKAVSLPSGERQSDKETILRADAAKVEARLADINARVQHNFPRYADLIKPQALTTEATISHLSTNEVLVLIKPLQDATFIWVVSKAGSRWIRANIGREGLLREVSALRCGLDLSAWRGKGALSCASLLGHKNKPQEGDLLPFDAARAHRLYTVLFDAAEDLIGDKHMLIVPSGALNALPFQTLVTERPEVAIPTSTAGYAKVKWLGQRNALNVLPSVASLQILRTQAKTSAAAGSYIGFGNPLLTGADGTDKRAWSRQRCALSQPAARPRTASDGVWKMLASFFRGGLANVERVRRQMPLPETADELCAVARALGLSDPDAAVYLGARATETNIKSLSTDGTLAGAKVVHFATHGLIAGETATLVRNRAEPSLMLTPPEKATKIDDGLLTASEVATLRLDADWVILSACNTAAGDAVGGDAFSGLARAFFYAGARALLVSHWYVDSQATVALITKALEAMRRHAGIGRGEALRIAMSDLIAAGGRNAHPANWAPFVVVGEGGAAH